jgi:uncharacterized protein YaiI (UPF0178 family)
LALGSYHQRSTTYDNSCSKLFLSRLLHNWEGVATGGPSAYLAADRQRFSEALDRLISRRSSAA